MRFLSLALGTCLLVVFSGCKSNVDYYCDPDTPCLPRYPDRPFCDLTGQYDPGGVRNTCVANPFDAGTGPDSGVAADARDDSMPSDAHTPPDANTPPDASLGDWLDPSIVLNINTSNSSELQPSVSPDGLELYFRRVSGTSPGDIYVATRPSRGNNWSIPTKIANTSGFYDPEISPNGLELYLDKSGQIYRATRPNRGSAWSTPAALFAGLRPSLTGDGLSLYVNDGSFAISRRTRVSTSAAWGAAQPVSLPSGVDGAYNQFTVDPSDTYMVLDSPFNAFQSPNVVAVSRPTTGQSWADPGELLSLSTVQAQGCDLVSLAEIYCAVDVGGNIDIYRATR